MIQSLASKIREGGVIRKLKCQWQVVKQEKLDNSRAQFEDFPLNPHQRISQEIVMPKAKTRNTMELLKLQS
jgi:hypothetical protein